MTGRQMWTVTRTARLTIDAPSTMNADEIEDAVDRLAPLDDRIDVDIDTSAEESRDDRFCWCFVLDSVGDMVERVDTQADLEELRADIAAEDEEDV